MSERARAAERDGDFLGARVNYMKAVEDLKRSGAPDSAVQAAMEEYAAFVERDPVFAKILSKLLPVISENPGILQSELTKGFPTMDWSDLYAYHRQVSQDDIRYALYFAEKQGRITRTKKGRSYELRAV